MDSKKLRSRRAPARRSKPLPVMPRLPCRSSPLRSSPRPATPAVFLRSPYDPRHAVSAKPFGSQLRLALPNLPQLSKPISAFHASTCLPIHSGPNRTEPVLACLSEPSRSVPRLTCLSYPDHGVPHLACAPIRLLPGHAAPCLPNRSLSSLGSTRHTCVPARALPSQPATRLPIQTQPWYVTPCLRYLAGRWLSVPSAALPANPYPAKPQPT